MKKIVLFFSLLLFNNYCFAATTATLQDSSGNVQGTSGNPLHVSLVGGGGGGSSLWETNSVGIDTFNPVGIGSTNPGQKLDVQGTIRAFSIQATGTGDSYINSSGGNVGIGNAAPGVLLDVSGTTRVTAFTLTGNNAAANLVLTASDSAGDATWSAAGSGTVNSGTAGQGAYYASSTNAVSGTSNIIISGSNVGIGSPTPGSTLDVQGTLRNFGNVTIGTSLSTNTLDVLGNAGFGTYAGAKIVPTNGLAVSGNVGIGTFSATSTLAVKGSLAVGTFAGLTPTIANSIIVSGNVGIGTVGTLGNNLAIYDGQASALRAVNTAAGGTTSGSQISLTSDAAAVSVLSDRLGAVIFSGAKDTAHTLANGASIQGFANGTWSGANSPGYLTFLTTPSGTTSQSERMRIDSTGNIGLGSASPGQFLDIQGTVRLFKSGMTANQIVCTCSDGSRLGHCTAAASVVANGSCTCADASGTC